MPETTAGVGDSSDDCFRQSDFSKHEKYKHIFDRKYADLGSIRKMGIELFHFIEL